MISFCLIADGHTATTCVISVFSTSARTEDCFVPTESETELGILRKPLATSESKASRLVCFLTVQGPSEKKRTK